MSRVDFALYSQSYFEDEETPERPRARGGEFYLEDLTANSSSSNEGDVTTVTPEVPQQRRLSHGAQRQNHRAGASSNSAAGGGSHAYDGHTARQQDDKSDDDDEDSMSISSYQLDELERDLRAYSREARRVRKNGRAGRSHSGHQSSASRRQQAVLQKASKQPARHVEYEGDEDNAYVLYAHTHNSGAQPSKVLDTSPSEYSEESGEDIDDYDDGEEQDDMVSHSSDGSNYSKSATSQCRRSNIISTKHKKSSTTKKGGDSATVRRRNVERFRESISGGQYKSRFDLSNDAHYEEELRERGLHKAYQLPGQNETYGERQRRLERERSRRLRREKMQKKRKHSSTG